MRWQNYPKLNQDLQKQFPEYSPVILQLLQNRGLTASVEIELWLHPDPQAALHDPFLFTNMQAVCDLIIKHVKAGNKIAIYGDYDADGVTSSGVLFEVLKLFKANVEVWIPSRIKHGYGLNVEIIKELAAGNTSLIITVDNGTRSKQEVAFAKELGLEIIVTDHHAGPSDSSELPDCLLINPILDKETYPFKYLAGVGVAFKVASALIEIANLDEQTRQNIKEKVLDLVAIGTVADCVSLRGENRALVQLGLAVLNKRRRPGLVELIRVAGIKDNLTEWSIGWQLAPRLNVAGRLDHANTAFEILVTADVVEAKALAENLQEKNITRQEITGKIVEQCRTMIEAEQANDQLLVCVEPQENANPWPEGVIGLVSGKLTEQYQRPVLVIANSEGKLKGSGRSIEAFSLVSALEYCDAYLDKYGGHKMAAGFTVKDLPGFIKTIKVFAKEQLTGLDLMPILKIEAEVLISDIDSELVDSVLKLSPFGQDNPLPILASKAVIIKDIQTMGADNQHIKFRLNGFWALAFNCADKWKHLQIGDKIDIAYNLEWNEFNGNKTIQLRAIDILAVT
jgi:single-stranded-DNA-specific exonuclease